MFFIITAFAAIISTIVWYSKLPNDSYKLGTLSLIFWGATLMWLVDHLIPYIEERGAFFELTLNATLLGIVVVLAGLALWLLILLISDPKDAIKKLLTAKK